MDARARLADARLYLCTDARRGRGDLVPFLDAVLGAGVDIVQLREKGLEARQEIELATTVAEACRRHGALFSINDRADVAAAVGPDILHLGQDDLPTTVARSILGDRVLLGRSTHSADQVRDAAQDAAVDYFCVGPTWPTPTKPGRPAPGLALLREAAAAGVTKPWFAIGGIDRTTVEQVLEAGAQRVVVVRALTEAADPAAAARALSRRLRG